MAICSSITHYNNDSVSLNPHAITFAPNVNIFWKTAPLNADAKTFVPRARTLRTNMIAKDLENNNCIATSQRSSDMLDYESQNLLKLAETSFP